jgi:hypothetical protein
VSLAHALLIVTAPISNDCSFDANQSLLLSYKDFDQDMAGGWRTLETRGCQLAAADLIRTYRHQKQELSGGERSVLSWHEGQLRAIAGDYKSAIPLLLGGVPENDPIDFVDYALGTVAFLQRDIQGLRAARSRLASAPRPATIPGPDPSGKKDRNVEVKVNWPPNLNVLDGLIRCFDKPYKQAYNCRS